MPIEVITYSKDDYKTVDRGETESPEAAMVAARALLEDAHANYVRHPRAAVYVDGQMVRCDITLHEIVLALVAEGHPAAPQFMCDWAFRDPSSAASRA